MIVLLVADPRIFFCYSDFIPESTFMAIFFPMKIILFVEYNLNIIILNAVLRKFPQQSFHL